MNLIEEIRELRQETRKLQKKIYSSCRKASKQGKTETSKELIACADKLHDIYCTLGNYTKE